MRVKLDRFLWFVTGLLILAACTEHSTPASSPVMPGGDPQRGHQAIRDYGCDTCHTIPGIQGAAAHVGPPLDAWADRRYIAGNLINTPDNLLRWLRYPQSVEPGTAMPDMGLTEQEARDIAAYLYTLRRDHSEPWFGLVELE